MGFVIIFNIFMILGSIDLYGFWGFVPVDAYAVFDEVTAASAFSTGVLTAEFMYKIAHGLAPKRRDNFPVITWITVGLIWLNFVGLAILQIFYHNQYYLFEAIKGFAGCAIALEFLTATTYYSLKVRDILQESMKMLVDKSQSEAQLRLLKSKHRRYTVVVTISAISLFALGIVSITNDDYSWTLAIADLPDPLQISLHVLYILADMLYLYLFKAPRLGDQSSTPSPGVGTNSNGKHHKGDNSSSHHPSDNFTSNTGFHTSVIAPSTGVDVTTSHENPQF
jgi:hypothetical protein